MGGADWQLVSRNEFSSRARRNVVRTEELPKKAAQGPTPAISLDTEGAGRLARSLPRVHAHRYERGPRV